MKQAVQVTILGQQYTVKSSAGAEQVQRVADFVNRQLTKTAEAAPTADTLHVTVLTLLNVAGLYLSQQERGGIHDPETEDRLLGLIRRLEEACSI